MRISDWSSDVCSSDLLIAGRHFRAGYGYQILQVLDVEIADAPTANLTVFLKLTKGGHGFFQRIMPRPMKQIAVKPIGAESPQRGQLGSASGRERGCKYV